VKSLCCFFQVPRFYLDRFGFILYILLSLFLFYYISYINLVLFKATYKYTYFDALLT